MYRSAVHLLKDCLEKPLSHKIMVKHKMLNEDNWVDDILFLRMNEWDGTEDTLLRITKTITPKVLYIKP